MNSDQEKVPLESYEPLDTQIQKSLGRTPSYQVTQFLGLFLGMMAGMLVQEELRPTLGYWPSLLAELIILFVVFYGAHGIRLWWQKASRKPSAN